MRPDRTEIAKAALIFGSGLFAIGFALAIPRELWVKPWLGEIGAVMVELPIILGFAWWLSVALMRAHRRNWNRVTRLVMGIGALMCLLLAELMLGILVLGQTLTSFLTTFLTVKGLAGLAAQALACSFPLLQMKAARS